MSHCTCAGRRKREAARREEERMRLQKKLTVSKVTNGGKYTHLIVWTCIHSSMRGFYTSLISLSLSLPLSLQFEQMTALVRTVEEELNFSKKATRSRIQQLLQSRERVNTHTHTHKPTYHAYMYMYTHTCMHIYIYIHVHPHMYTYTHNTPHSLF